MIYELRFEDEMTEQAIGDLLGITMSRICQIIRDRIKPKLEAAVIVHEVADLYRDDPEYSKLSIRWIEV